MQEEKRATTSCHNTDIKALLRTLSFYDAVGKIPLTVFELHKYAIKLKNAPHISIKGIIGALEQAKNDGNSPIQHKNGYYFLKNNTNAYKKHLETGKTSIKKWKKALKYAKIISLLPYVRMVFITGSLAHNATHQESDIDVLICAKAGRIWSVRLIVSAVMHMLGKRRHDNKISNKACLNHYISEAGPRLRPNNLFSAHIACSSVLIWGYSAQEKNFYKQNSPLILGNFANIKGGGFLDIRRLDKRPKALYVLPFILECVFEKTPMADKIELLLQKIQIRKMKNTMTKNAIDEKQVIFDNLALVFNHPRPRKQRALPTYKDNLKIFCP